VNIVAVIPARFASSRFPGKPLAKDTGKYLIQHVYEQVCQAESLNEVWIATDDERIGRACDEIGARWRMTRPDHPSGTDRIAEAVADLDTQIIVNIQGDEPEISPDNIDHLVQLLQNDPQADMATLSAAFDKNEDPANPNIVKVVADRHHHALYFSRWPIPFNRDPHEQGNIKYCKHLGLYAYRREALLKLSQLKPTPLELAEKLEQLRALENGMVIAVAEVEHTAAGIDTPQQYEEFVTRYKTSINMVS
jgi:3-deoxy-manno-octulosonate cytidylyltransferase (CMP-KDO synthetase)